MAYKMFSDPELPLNLYFIEMGKCIFSHEWPCRCPYVKEMDSRFKAHCSARRNSIDIMQMEEKALRSHANREVHKRLEISRTGTLTLFYQQRNENLTRQNVKNILKLEINVVVKKRYMK